jgi:hypothetical protein
MINEDPRFLDDAIAYYHRLLEESGDAVGAFRDEFVHGMEERHLTFGGRPLCHVLRPHFISESQYELLRSAGSTLVKAIYRLQREILNQPDWLEALDLSDSERQLVAIDPGYDWISRNCRLDSFLQGDSLRFVEFNAESPAGIAYADNLAELFQNFPVMQQFGRRYRFRGFMVRPCVERVLLKAWQEFGGSGAPRIAIVDYRGLPTATEFEMFREFFESRGLRTVVCDPRELEYQGGRLRWKDFEIDLVYRRVLVNEFLERLSEVGALLNAYRDRAVCVVNSFRVKLVHKKMLFGVLTDETLASFFTAEERAVIARHVPWTRRAQKGWTLREGKKIDLCDFILKNKDTLVLKPNDEYGGKGIFIGWECSSPEWEKALSTALEGSYVVQDKVQVARSVFPGLSCGSIQYLDQLVDLDPYIFDGEVHGCLTRLSATALCNVTSGGGQTSTFVISAAE